VGVSEEYLRSASATLSSMKRERYVCMYANFSALDLDKMYQIDITILSIPHINELCTKSIRENL
jgi:hypothetical protein